MNNPIEQELSQKTILLNSLFSEMNENVKDKIVKLQNIFKALSDEYSKEIALPNANKGKLIGLLNHSMKIDTIILTSIFNKSDPTEMNSPLRFYIYDLGMINIYLNPMNYEQNKEILSKLHDINNFEDLNGYVEVISYVNNVINDLNIFAEGELQKNTYSEEIPMENVTVVNDVEIEDGVKIKV